MTTAEIEYNFTDLRTIDHDRFNRWFDEQVENLKESFPSDHLAISFNNPIVLQSLVVISVIVNRPVVDISYKDLAGALIEPINGYGEQMVSDLARLRGFFMLFSSNSPLTQNAFAGHNKKVSAHSPLQSRLYRLFLLEFLRGVLNDLDSDGESNRTCMVSGEQTKFDFYKVEEKINLVLGKDDQNVGAGPTRNWFPLMGSAGSDLQSLPSLSMTFDIAPLYLFIAQFLPYSTPIYRGKLTIFQTFDLTFLSNIVGDVFRGYKDQLQTAALADKVEIFGKGKNDFLLKQLMNRIIQASTANRTFELNLWLINNSGTGADAEILSLPNKAIAWIVKASVELNRQAEVEKFLEFEQSGMSNQYDQLFSCLIDEKDYPVFYLFSEGKKKKAGDQPVFVPFDLYLFYQHSIMGWSLGDLKILVQLSSKIKETVEKEELVRTRKEGSKQKYRELLYKGAIELAKDDSTLASPIIRLVSFDRTRKHHRNSIIDILKFMLYPTTDLVIFDSSYERELPTEMIFWGNLVSLMAKLILFHEKGRIGTLDKLLREINYGTIHGRITKWTNGVWFPYALLAYLTKELCSYNLFEEVLKLSLVQLWEEELEWAEIRNELEKASNDFKGKQDLHLLSPQVTQELNAYLEVRSNSIGYERLFPELISDLARVRLENLEERIRSKEYNGEKLSFTSAAWIQSGMNNQGEFQWSLLGLKLKLYLNYLRYKHKNRIDTEKANKTKEE